MAAHDLVELCGLCVRPAGGPADLSVSRPRWWTWDLKLPHLILAFGLAAGALYGIHSNAQNNHLTCKAVLTVSRNLFTPLPTDGSTSPELRDYIEHTLTPLYYGQYHQIDKAFQLEQRCGGDLPKGTPPPPTMP